jgi:beta-lactamase class A
VSLLRRSLIAGAAAALAAPAKGRARIDFARLEAESGGRLGVHAVNVGSGRSFGHRADERFAMCSTFKGLLAGAVLARADAGQERLDRIIPISAGDLVPHAPVTGKHVGQGLPIGALCAATVEVSDNPAANLLLNTLGGPVGFTAFVRTLGDNVTRLDRFETELNSAIAGDLRDTTTPAAVLRSYRELLLGRALKGPSRAQLSAWMARATTGLHKIRKHAPLDWRTGDKTGNGANGTSNDVAILRPPEGPPLLVAVYITASTKPLAARDAVMAEVGRLAIEGLA